MKCEKCGAGLSRGDQFCGECGHPVKQRPGEEQSSAGSGNSELFEFAMLVIVFGVSLFAADAIWIYLYDNFPQHTVFGEDWFVYGSITTLAFVFAVTLRKTAYRNIISVSDLIFLSIAVLCPLAFVSKFQVVPDGIAHEALGLEPYSLTAETLDKVLFAVLAAALCLLVKKLVRRAG